jgi:hypothetical protein
MSNGTVAAAAVYTLVACIVAVTLLSSLFSRQRRRLTAVQAELKRLSDDVRSLEIAHQALLVRFMNLPRSRDSSPALELEAAIAPKQPNEKANGSAPAHQVDA